MNEAPGKGSNAGSGSATPDTQGAAAPDPTLARYGPEKDMRMVSVYVANDELSARLMQGALTNNGVPAYIHSEQTPMFGTIMEMGRGCWGEVMVPEPYEDRAADIVAAFSSNNAESMAASEAEADALADKASPEDVERA